MTMTKTAYYTIFMHFDGYWIVDTSMADAVLANPEEFRDLVAKAPTKLAASRRAWPWGSSAAHGSYILKEQG
jgi:hypothetical protein